MGCPNVVRRPVFPTHGFQNGQGFQNGEPARRQGRCTDGVIPPDQLEWFHFACLVGIQVGFRDEAAVLLEGAGNTAGDLAAVKGLDGIALGETLQEISQVRIAEHAARRDRLTVLEKELCGTAVLGKPAARVADGVCQCWTYWETFASIANSRLEYLAQRLGAIAI